MGSLNITQVSLNNTLVNLFMVSSQTEMLTLPDFIP